MEVSGNLTPLLGSSLVRLDGMRLKQLQCEKVYQTIDKLASLSADCVHLQKPLTSCEKLFQSDNALYLAWEYDEARNVSILLGFLKVGHKKLFLYDRKMITYEGEFLCLLDFYVHFSHQRKGIGRQLFDHMLKSERVVPYQVPLDNPTVTLLAFMGKNYDLTDPIWQNTNFVVFPQLFDSERHQESSAPEGWSRPSTPRKIGNGSTETRWLNNAIPGHQSKGQLTGVPVDADTSTEGTLANRAHQARQRKCQLLSSNPLCFYQQKRPKQIYGAYILIIPLPPLSVSSNEKNQLRFRE
uniref:Alpha-tubulin N-acetyltransferase n=1 Tax=Panagrolaimus sp. JU765 TaxID=591449 RepID=A0AC34RIN6_9BILA